MNKNKLFVLLIAGLTLANFLLISYLVFRKEHRYSRPEPREIIIERLHFDKNQIVEYDKLIKDHKMQIREKEGALMDLKSKFYSYLSDDNKYVEITDSLANEIGEVQSEIERINHTHFEQIKKLCHTEQLNDFNELISELARLFSPPPRRKPQ